MTNRPPPNVFSKRDETSTSASAMGSAGRCARRILFSVWRRASAIETSIIGDGSACGLDTSLPYFQGLRASLSWRDALSVLPTQWLRNRGSSGSR
ncbi:hypothetical protein M514_00566 [Trichuris suis]|uniref:Uncharacterized protein n=1 Tax=Trichuris suis TaxID=68888 RepID=A0A085MM94_9BILA|nr:hypothetical protein M513_00566 [Trichuris suis]KFD60168.1 hypothetical protein M514_00566 [Trichuris suis]